MSDASERSLRVLVVEDSLTVRKHLIEVLSTAPGIEVVGEASDGRRAIELCDALRPDVITMDMILSGMSGLAATEHIMAYTPTPILIISASTNRGEVCQTYEALAAGAVDVLDKPRGGPGDEATWNATFLATLRRVARIRVITHPRGRLGGLGRQRAASEAPAVLAALPESVRERRLGLVAIGASTGGPSAVVSLLRALRPDFPLPVLVVIHISERFGSALADWLDSQSPLPVRDASDGLALPPRGQGCVILARPGRHLELRDGRLRLTSGPERQGCRPSIDVLFESLAREQGARVAACLLTGMGRDGAEGLLALQRAGALTIAQDEASSTVWGMPRAAVELGAASLTLPLEAIAPTLARLAGGGARR